MDLKVIQAIVVLLTVATFFSDNIYASIVIWLLLLLSVAYSTEISIAVYRVTIWYNVLVVSTAITIPQTIFALRLAEAGYHTAAWIDTIMSTVVDAIFASALVRRNVIGTAYMWGLLPLMVMWTITAISINLYTSKPFMPIGLYSPVMLVLGYIVLPIMIVLRHRERWEMPPASAMFVLAFNTIALFVASYNIAELLLQLKATETQLGIISVILATLPDLIVAMLIRGAMSLVLSDVAGDREAVATMLAAAIHDQISVPALLLLFHPESALYYPHALALFAIVVKFTLLDRKTFWFIGLPSSLILFLILI